MKIFNASLISLCILLHKHMIIGRLSLQNNTNCCKYYHNFWEKVQKIQLFWASKSEKGPVKSWWDCLTYEQPVKL